VPARASGCGNAPAIGSAIGISIDAGAVLVFEPENGNAASAA